jgi:hypothetical protein
MLIEDTLFLTDRWTEYVDVEDFTYFLTKVMGGFDGNLYSKYGNICNFDLIFFKFSSIYNKQNSSK